MISESGVKHHNPNSSLPDFWQNLNVCNREITR